MPEYGWRTWEVRGRSLVAKGHGKASTCGGRVPHGPASSLATCGTRAPHMGMAGLAYFVGQNCPSSLYFQTTWISSNLKFCRNVLDFDLLTLIITSSYELEIEWFKNQNCWSQWELQTPSIFRGNWFRHFSQHSDFQYEVISCMWYFFSCNFIWSSLWFFLFDCWNMLRSMLDHMLGLYDWLVNWV